MSERIAKHKTRLAKARDILNEAFDAVADLDDDTLVHSHGEDAWTLRQLAVHVALADKGHNGMIMHYAEGKEFIPEDYDLERYNRGSVKKHADMTVADARESLTQSREKLLAYLDTLDDEQLDNVGRHATLEMMSVDRILQVTALHERMHAEDIQAMLGKTTAD